MPTERIVADRTAVVDVLRRIEARIGDPEHWTRREMARRADGERAPFNSPKACQWCLHGAVMVETGPSFGEIYHATVDLLMHTAREMFPRETGYLGVNDHQGHDAVMSVVRKAIELAQEHRP